MKEKKSNKKKENEFKKYKRIYWTCKSIMPQEKIITD